MSMLHINNLDELRSFFIGNSHVNRMNIVKNENIQKFGVGGGRFEHLQLHHILDKMPETKYHHVHLHIGENDINANTIPKDMASQIVKLGMDLVTNNKCDVVTIGSLILQEEPRHLSKDEFLKIVNAVNQQLKRLCLKKNNFSLIFISKDVCQYCHNDGVHLTYEGYNWYKAKIREIGYELYTKVLSC